MCVGTFKHSSHGEPVGALDDDVFPSEVLPVIIIGGCGLLTKALDLDLSEPCFNIIDKIIFRLGIVSIRIWIDRRIDRSKSPHLLERHLHFAQQARIDGLDIIEDRRAGLPDTAEEIAPELTDEKGIIIRLAVTIRINIAGQRRGAPERSHAQEIGNDLNAKQRNG